MKKKSIDKRIYIALAVVIIFLVLIFITLLIYSIKNEPHDHGVMGINYAEDIADEPNLTFTNIGALEIYSSDSSKQIEIAKNFRRIFEDELPNLYNQIDDLDSSEYGDYYEDNKKSIESNFYDIDKKDFISLCKYIMSLESNLYTDYKNCDFQKGESGVNVICEYKNGEKIMFNFTLDKKLVYLAN